MLEKSNSPKISVLIPVYNVEKYVGRCILSVLNQTIQESIEIIIVNDSTPDNSMEVINNIIENSPNVLNGKEIKIVNHENNKGIAFTRMTALNYATGDYILQIDSDDYLDKDMLEKMYAKAIVTGADIVGCDLWRVYPDKKVYEKDDIKKNKAELLGEVVKTQHGARWNKLIKRKLLKENKIETVDGLDYGEDCIFMIQCFYLANKIDYIPYPFYNYVQYNNSSICHLPVSEKNLKDIIAVIDFTSKFLEDNNIAGYDYELAYKKLKTKFKCMTNTTGRLRKQYYEMYPEANRYKYRFLREWRKEVSSYQFLTCFFALNGYSCLLNSMLSFRNILQHFRNKY